jgi:hypothetical protein
MWKEEVLVWVEVVFEHLVGATEENYTEQI